PEDESWTMEVENKRIIEALSEQLMCLLRGETAEHVEYVSNMDSELADLCDTVNRLGDSFKEARAFIQTLAEGNLDVTAPTRNLLASPYKQLQANLLHLTWQTKQIAAGDYSQRVYFMGVFSTAFNTMVEALEEKRRTEALLRETQARVKHLEGIIPICMYCKKIRDDEAIWQQMEKYISDHSGAMFSHSICPECYENVKADLAKMKEAKPAKTE
ncbi:MAG TPA: hypothetical protein VF795_01020, partial [Desulfuromonadaceae bacterium]